MAGKVQHEIPQLFQRGFLIPETGDAERVFVFRRGGHSYPSNIDRSGAESYFYSPLSTDGSKTLDDTITDYEGRLGGLVHTLRAVQIGDVADPSVAAEVAAHLIIRNGHLRGAIAYGLRTILTAAGQLLGDETNVRYMLGLTSDVPTAKFNELFQKMLADEPMLSALGLSPILLERMAFTLAQENFAKLFAEQMPLLGNALSELADRADNEARTAHNKALGQSIAPDARIEMLKAFVWTMEEAPLPGAILPDCVALGVHTDSEVHPLMMAANEELAAVIMPISTDRILVGRLAGAPKVDLNAYNDHAAACSQRYFVAAKSEPAIQGLSAQIGKRALAIVDTAMAEAVEEFLPQDARDRDLLRSDQAQEEEVSSDTEAVEASSAEAPSDDLAGYQISLIGYGDQQIAERVGEWVQAVVLSMRKSMPLARLDGVTFTDDYARALRELNGEEIPEDAARPLNEHFSQRFAMSPLVDRDGVMKTRIIMRAGFVDAFLSEDQDQLRFALHTFVHQLAYVACTDLIEQALPGVLGKPIPDEYEGGMYQHGHVAWTSYFCARASAGFGSEDTQQAQAALAEAVRNARPAMVEAARAATPTRDYEGAARNALPIASNLARVAAEVLGHIDGYGQEGIDNAELIAALDEAGLRGWLDIYLRDLRRMWDRRGEWENVGELFAFNRHIERIMWIAAIFCWQTPEGLGRIDMFFPDLAAA